MDNFLIIIGSVLVFVGIAASVLTIIPGPLVSFIGLLFLQFTSERPFRTGFMIAWAVIIFLITLLEYTFPFWRKKMIGGTRSGINSATFGLIAGLFIFPPFGIIFGPIIGAIIGEIARGNTTNLALKTS